MLDQHSSQSPAASSTHVGTMSLLQDLSVSNINEVIAEESKKLGVNLKQKENKLIVALQQQLRELKLNLDDSQKNNSNLENQLHRVQKELERCQTKQKTESKKFEKENKLMSVNSALLLKECEKLRDATDMWKELCRSKISFTAFAVNDLALFYKNENGMYQAFHQNNPHRYLSEESKKSAEDSQGLGPFVLGHIIVMDKYTVEKSPNPLKLSVGTVYYLLTVELIKVNPADNVPAALLTPPKSSDKQDKKESKAS
jgi:TolA-binding protein